MELSNRQLSLAKFRTSSVTPRDRVHEMLLRKKSNDTSPDDRTPMLEKRFQFAQLHLDHSLADLHRRNALNCAPASVLLVISETGSQ